jgi:DNA (cytosine-5)-methyltransferase 1
MLKLSQSKNYIFYYNNLTAGYKMVGNAVPCYLAYYVLAKAIKSQIKNRLQQL